jgi:hypothetical protein
MTNGLVSVVKAQNPGHTRISTSTLEPLGGYGLMLSSFLFRYFLKFEKFIPSKAHPGVMAAEHGADGPIEGNNKSQRHDSWSHCSVIVGFHGNHSLVSQRFIDACSRVGIPLRADLNTPYGTIGVAKVSRFPLCFSLLI